MLFALCAAPSLVFVFFFSSRRRHTRCLSDWSSDVCSSDLRVSGMDHRTQERADGIFLFADAAWLDRLCWRTNPAPVDLLLPRADFLCAGALGESDRLHTSGCIVPDSLVAEQADHDAPSHSDCSFCHPRHWHGTTRSLVGTLPSGNEPRCVYLSHADRANPRGEPGCLLLPDQNLLAFQSDLYLPEMEHFTGGLTRLHLVARRHRGVRGHLLP